MDQRDAYANLLLPSLLGQRGLAGRDAALATELTYGTLRGRGTYDAILGLCSDRALDRVDPPLREVLRLGTHQLLATRVAPHAAVATSVDLARDLAGPRSAGFVNAVLRRVSTRDLESWIGVAAPPRDATRSGTWRSATATRAGWRRRSPRPWARTWRARSARPRPRWPRTASGRGSRCARCPGWPPRRSSWPRARSRPGGRSSAPISMRATRRASGRSARGARPCRTRPASSPPSRWPGPAWPAGTPGGSTCARGREARPGCWPAWPPSAARTCWPPTRGRTAPGWPGTRPAITGAAGAVVADATRPAWAPGTFDRVLADVPCSGTGALRRRPEARWRKSPEDVLALGGLQRRLLGSALDAARPGGVVAYVTCSPHLAETRDVLADVLGGRDDTEVLDAPAVLAEVPGLRCPEPGSRYAQFWPHRHGSDAIFLALLRRR